MNAVQKKNLNASMPEWDCFIRLLHDYRRYRSDLVFQFKRIWERQYVVIERAKEERFPNSVRGQRNGASLSKRAQEWSFPNSVWGQKNGASLRCPSVRYSWRSYLYWAIPSGYVTWGLNQKNLLCKVLGWYSPFCFFTADWVCGKKYSPPTEYAVKIIPCPLSMR
jgi:hypothetical protein